MGATALDHSISSSTETLFINPRMLCALGDSASRIRWEELSPWSRSALKRVFDCVCVLLALPLLIPLMMAVAAAVFLTSSGPVLFLQKRVGRSGQVFTIFKFRTLIHSREIQKDANASSRHQCLTPAGPFLRRWKLDELPQLVNVLLGQMSLVGPRPKLAQFVISAPSCRPGITGLATTAFACEERILARVPPEHLDAYIHAVVLPAKRQLDAEYMARATFRSDLALIVKTVLRRWDYAAIQALPSCGEVAARA
jgi:lipopolysaccharide/colanic/teichoic acid biosynthesis glycosyltransferase